MKRRASRDFDRETSAEAFCDVKKRFSSYGFVRGNLVRIEMKNFLTFKDTFVEPGPRLNLIIGPNGTGKSSIVNAVCIVFGGKLSLLGRSGDLGSFVRHGSQQACVEVWIFDPLARDDVRRVKRVFDTEGGSRFFVDGKKSPFSAISALSREYDVQLDNLSQFMPQEKIAEFVNIKPQELLNITIRSLGGTPQVEKYKELITTGLSLANATQRTKLNEEKLGELKARNESSHAEVQAFKEQRELKKTIRLAEKLLPHRQAEELHDHLRDLITEKNDVGRKVEELKKRIRDSEQGHLRQLDLNRKATRDDFNVAKTAVATLERNASEPLEEAEEITIQLSAKKQSLRDLKNSSQRYEKQVQEARRITDDCRQRLLDVTAETNEQADQAALVQCTQQRNVLLSRQREEDNMRGSAEQARVNAERAIVQLNRKIDSLGNIRVQRIQYLDRIPRFRGIAGAVEVVRGLMEEKKFREHVFGPVLAEISCNDQYHSRIMEGCVSGFLMGAFVTENIGDSRTLISECKKRMNGWSPDIITSPTLPNGEKDDHAHLLHVPERPVDDRLRHLGIVAMVSDIFQAPDAVRAALNAQAMLHNIHVGSDRAEEHAEDLRREQGIKTWYTPSARCSVVKSRYDESVRSLRMETRFKQVQGKLYSGSLDQVERERNRLIHGIRVEEENRNNATAQLSDISTRISQVRAEIEDVDRRSRQIHTRQKKKADLSLALGRHEQHLEKLQSRPSVVTLERKRESLLANIVSHEEKSVCYAPKLVSALCALKNSMKDLDAAAALRVQAERAYDAEKEKSSSLHNELNEEAQTYESKKAEVRNAKGEWKRLKKEAEHGFSDEEMADAESIIGPWLQKSSEWLINEIEKFRGRIQGLSTMGPNILAEYEDRQRKIQELEKSIQVERSKHESRRTAFDEDKTEFLTWLDLGISSMRTKFSDLYRRLGCAGDLEICNAQSDSLDDLELQILVSYREGSALRPISASSNSGGEKMCCTMLFCFSLLHEDARMPPFVMVDELNQGLDPANEMKIMTIMFEDAERGSAPQSFVVTPKLLPDLPFQDATKTHIIFNGSIFKDDVTSSFP